MWLHQDVNQKFIRKLLSAVLGLHFQDEVVLGAVVQRLRVLEISFRKDIKTKAITAVGTWAALEKAKAMAINRNNNSNQKN